MIKTRLANELDSLHAVMAAHFVPSTWLSSWIISIHFV